MRKIQYYSWQDAAITFQFTWEVNLGMLAKNRYLVYAACWGGASESVSGVSAASQVLGRINGGTIAAPVPLCGIPRSFNPALVSGPPDGSLFFSDQQNFNGAVLLEFATITVDLLVQPYSPTATMQDTFVSITIGVEYDEI